MKTAKPRPVIYLSPEDVILTAPTFQKPILSCTPPPQRPQPRPFYHGAIPQLVSTSTLLYAVW